MKKIGFLLFLIVSITFDSFSQNDWVSDHDAFRALIQKEFMSHPYKTESDGVYITYFIKIIVNNGLITEISYSDSTPEFVVRRAKSNLANLNERIKEKEIVLIEACSLIVPVLMIWKDNPDKDRNNIIEVLPNLFPQGVNTGCQIIDAPLFVNIYKPVS